MPSIHVIYDPFDLVKFGPDDAEVRQHMGIEMAKLSVPENLENVDIYNVAKKLCELLLENLDRGTNSE